VKRLMRIASLIGLLALIGLAVAAGIIEGLRFTRLEHRRETSAQTHTTSSNDSQFRFRTQYRGDTTASLRAAGEQGNILELPQASSDFVGYWGGYVHSSIQRFDPDLVGNSPDRVSVIFGRQRDTVFMTGKLYAPPGQRIAQRPKAKIVDTRITVIEYELADKALYYSCRDTFRLESPSIMSYRGIIDVRDLNSRRLLGVVTQIAVLKRLLTEREQLQFARPARNQIPRASVVAVEQFGTH
jgi:hypothetical protein